MTRVNCARSAIEHGDRAAFAAVDRHGHGPLLAATRGRWASVQRLATAAAEAVIGRVLEIRRRDRRAPAPRRRRRRIGDRSGSRSRIADSASVRSAAKFRWREATLAPDRAATGNARTNEEPRAGRGARNVRYGLKSDQMTEFDPIDQLPLRHVADLGRRDLAVLEQHQGRNAAHAIALRRLRIVVDVDLGDGQLAVHVLGDLFQRRGDHLARTAPLRPEIDQHRAARFQDVGFERRVADMDGVGGRGRGGSRSLADAHPSVPVFGLCRSGGWTGAIQFGCRIPLPSGPSGTKGRTLGGESREPPHRRQGEGLEPCAFNMSLDLHQPRPFGPEQEAANFPCSHKGLRGRER